MFQDLRFVLRSLASNKRYTFLVLLTLGLGLGLSTAAYSVLHGRFLRGLPYSGADNLMRIHKIDVNNDDLAVSLREVRSWQEHQRAFTTLAAWHGLTIDMAVDATPTQRYNGSFVGEGVLEQLQVQPVQGRFFTPEEFRPGAPAVVLLGHSVSQDRFGEEDPVGRVVRIYGQPATVVGVMPPGFQFPLRQSMWMPLAQSPSFQAAGEDLIVQVVGRLRGRDTEAAQTELTSILSNNQPADDGRMRVEPYSEGYTDTQLRDQHVKLLALIVGLLLLCCANVTNLMLTRTLGRLPEISLRASLGASRWRLIRLVTSESVILSVLSGLLGLGIAEFVTHRYLQLEGQDDGFPFWTSVKLDINVFLVVLLAAIGVGLMCGLLPAIRTLSQGITSGVGRAQGADVKLSFLRQALVAGQVALCITLLLATGLVVRSFHGLQAQGFGVQPEGILTAGLSLFGEDLPDDTARLQTFDEIGRRIGTLPGVESYGWTYTLPGHFHRTGRFTLEGSDQVGDERPSMRFSIVTPGFFRTLDLQPLHGRLFEDRDRADSESVILINARFAKKYFPEQQALDQRIQVSGQWRTVVGVVPDLILGNIEGEDTEAMYLPLSQLPVVSLNLVVRSEGSLEALMPLVRREVNAVVPNRPVLDLRPMEQVLTEATRPYRASALVFSSVGILALGLAMMGLYANLSSFVLYQRRNLGIRMAVGADRKRILFWVLGQGGKLLLLGLGAGLLISLNLTQVMGSFLYKMSPWAPGLFASVAIGFALLGLLACLAPAVRASRMDPTILLRAE